MLTNDPKGAATRKVDVQPSERGNAGALNLQHVVGTLQSVRLAVEVERQVREAGDLGTVHSVLPIPRLLCANLRVEHLGHVSGEGDQGSA